MVDRWETMWGLGPKQYISATGEIVDPDSGWQAPGRLGAQERQSYLVANDPDLIEGLRAAQLAFEALGVATAPGSGPIEARSSVQPAAARLRLDLLRSLEHAWRARARNDVRGFHFAMARGFGIIQEVCLLAVGSTAETGTVESDTAETGGTASYEVRHGVTVKSVLVLLVSAGIVVLFATTDTSLPIAIAVYLSFGVGGLLYLLDLLLRRVALRIDNRGITLGGPFYRRATTVPWADVAAVVLFRVKLVPYLGVELRYGAVPPRRRSVVSDLASLLVRHIPSSAVENCVAVFGWSLDRDRLVAAVQSFAPSVEIVDAG